LRIGDIEDSRLPPHVARTFRSAFVCFLLLLATTSAQSTLPVTVRVDLSREVGDLKPTWAFFGYDEPNYTYMKDGTKLLSQLAALSPVPVYVRTHNLLTSGDGTPSLKWGSTNAYTEDAQGRPRYDWTIVDRIFDQGFATVASFPEWKNTPIVIGESDPEGCAACSARVHKQNAYRNGTMYSSYTAASFPRKYELARRHGVTLLASKAPRAASVLLWHYHDDDVTGPEAAVNVSLNGLPAAARRVLVRRYCIDNTHSNSYAAWMRMGSPAVVSGEQYADLERAASLATCGSPEWRDVTSGSMTLQFALPRQAVSMLEVSWE
jgi:hypothetical protein